MHTFDVSSWATRDEKKCTPCTPEPLFLAIALKPNTFKMMIYEFFDFLVFVSWAIHMIL